MERPIIIPVKYPGKSTAHLSSNSNFKCTELIPIPYSVLVSYLSLVYWAFTIGIVNPIPNVRCKKFPNLGKATGIGNWFGRCVVLVDVIGMR